MILSVPVFASVFAADSATGAGAASYIILGAAALGLIANTIAVIGVAVRIGGMLGDIKATGSQVAHEISVLRDTRDEHIRIIERVTTQLTDLERRLTREEKRWDDAERRSGADRRIAD